MQQTSDSPIVVIAVRELVPLIQLFALYVIAHGHYSPGGGFQGGALFAASLLLSRLALGNNIAQLQFKRIWGTPWGAVGTLAYVAIGLGAIVGGGVFLDYEYLWLFGFSGAELRSLGILLIEVAVGIAVAATLVAIADDLGDETP